MSEDSQFPDWYTIDTMGLDALKYFLKDEFAGKTVKISVEVEENTCGLMTKEQIEEERKERWQKYTVR